MSAFHVNDENFGEEVLRDPRTVLVDFWAPWCGPCRAMSGVVEEVADEVADRARVVKANVDDAKEAASQFGVSSIPAFVVLRDGKVQSQFTGIVPKQRLLDALEPASN